MAVTSQGQALSVPGMRGPVVAIVLAAGKSERFGEQKLLTRIDGSTILGATLAALRSSGVDGIVVVLGHGATEISQKVDLRGLNVLTNPEFSTGISSSIKKGISGVGSEVAGVLIVLGDQPLVRPSTYDALMEAYRGSSYRAVVPLHRGTRGNPVLLDLSLRPQMEGLRGDVGCRSFLSDLPDVLELEVGDPGVLVDVDTQEDLDHLQTMATGGAIHE